MTFHLKKIKVFEICTQCQKYMIHSLITVSFPAWYLHILVYRCIQSGFCFTLDDNGAFACWTIFLLGRCTLSYVILGCQHFLVTNPTGLWLEYLRYDISVRSMVLADNDIYTSHPTLHYQLFCVCEDSKRCKTQWKLVLTIKWPTFLSCLKNSLET